jgi:hypothetical protein
MTLITLKDGKPVVRDGKVGAAQACCCGCSCCIIDGVCKCQYTTKAACEDCDRTYECYEVVQTQCDGTCPGGFGDTPGYVAPIIITHEGYGCWGWGSYYGEAAAVIGCGEILSATITSQYGQLARLGRVAPTITAALHISEGSGAVLGVTLEQSTDGCGRKVWSVVAVNVIDGGSGYGQDYAAYISFDTAAGDSVDFGGFAYPEVDETGAIVNVYVENGGQYYREDPSATPDVASPTITIDDGLFGSGAVITPNIDTNTSSPTFGEITSLTVENGGSGYRALCSRTTEVTSCEDCPSHGPDPEFSLCTLISAEGACGTWQQVDCEDVDPDAPCCESCLPECVPTLNVVDSSGGYLKQSYIVSQPNRAFWGYETYDEGWLANNAGCTLLWVEDSVSQSNATGTFCALHPVTGQPQYSIRSWVRYRLFLIDCRTGSLRDVTEEALAATYGGTVCTVPTGPFGQPLCDPLTACSGDNPGFLNANPTLVCP